MRKIIKGCVAIMMGVAALHSSAIAGNHKEHKKEHREPHSEGRKGHPHGMPPGLAKKADSHPGVVAFKDGYGQQFFIKDGRVYNKAGALVNAPDGHYRTDDGKSVVVQNGTPTVGQVVGTIVEQLIKK